MKSIKTNVLLNIIKQLCTIAFPLITLSYANRVLGPENMGVFSFSQSTVSYFSYLAALGVSTYGMRNGSKIRDNIGELSKFVSEVYSINIFSTLISLLLFFSLLFTPFFSEYRNIMIVLSASVPLTTLGSDWVNSIFEDYMYITMRYIVFQLIGIVLLFSFVKSSSDLILYSLVYVISSAGGNLLNIFYIRKKIKIRFTFKANVAKHFIPLLIFFVNNIASIIYLSSDIVLIGFLLDNKAVGIYSNASKSYSVIKALINAAITVLVPRLSYCSARETTDDYKNIVERVIHFVLMLLMPISIGLLFEAKNVLLILGGEKFVSGESTLMILASSLIPSSLACIFSYCILTPLKKEKIFMTSTIAAAVANIIFSIILIPLLGIMAAALTTLFSEIIVVIISAIYSQRVIKLQINRIEIIKYVVGAIPIIYICMLTEKIILEPILSFSAAVCLSAVSYFGILLLLKSKTLLSVLLTFNNKVRSIIK